MLRAPVSLVQGLVNLFFSARYRVEGKSMLPALGQRDSILVVPTRFTWNKLRRGDVAVFEGPEGKEDIYIKRVVGLPDEDVRTSGGRVYLNGKLLEESYVLESGNADSDQSREWFNGANEYFLMGDNRADSNDSRAFGPVSESLIKGRAWFRCWPLLRLRPIRRG